MNKFILRFFVLSAALCFGFSSCSDDDDDKDKTPTYENVKIKTNGKHIITGGSGWTSSEERVAIVDKDTLKGVRVGEAEITSAEGYKFNVTIDPVYNTYKEPFCGWGYDMGTIKSAMNDYKGYELFWEEEENLGYACNGIDIMMIYAFENSKLKYASVLLNSSIYAQEAGAFIAERYIVNSIDNDNQIIFCTSLDNRTGVAITMTEIENTIYVLIMYIPTELDTKAVNEDIFDATKLKKFGAKPVSKDVSKRIFNTMVQTIK